MRRARSAARKLPASIAFNFQAKHMQTVPVALQPTDLHHAKSAPCISVKIPTSRSIRRCRLGSGSADSCSLHAKGRAMSGSCSLPLQYGGGQFTNLHSHGSRAYKAASELKVEGCPPEPSSGVLLETGKTCLVQVVIMVQAAHAAHVAIVALVACDMVTFNTHWRIDSLCDECTTKH